MLVVNTVRKPEGVVDIVEVTTGELVLAEVVGSCVPVPILDKRVNTLMMISAGRAFSSAVSVLVVWLMASLETSSSPSNIRLLPILFEVVGGRMRRGQELEEQNGGCGTGRLTAYGF